MPLTATRYPVFSATPIPGWTEYDWTPLAGGLWIRLTVEDTGPAVIEVAPEDAYYLRALMDYIEAVNPGARFYLEP